MMAEGQLKGHGCYGPTSHPTYDVVVSFGGAAAPPNASFLTYALLSPTSDAAA